jgi:cystathionine beta-lyase
MTMPEIPPFAGLTAAELRDRGSLKWAAFPDTVPAWVAETDFTTAPEIVAALHAAVEGGVFGYMPPALPARMAQACADWLGTRFDWHVEPAGIRPLADVLSAYEQAMTTLLPDGGAVIVPTPAYPPFLVVPQRLGIEVIEVPMIRSGDRWTMDLEGVDAAFRAGGRLLVHCDPHNPTGTVATADEHRAITAVVERHGGRVFFDAIHAPVVYSGSRHVPYAATSDAAAAHSVTAISAAKGWNLPGLKAAQLILTSEADLARWTEHGGHAEHGASTLGVVAATAAFGRSDAWMHEVTRYLEGNRDHLLARLAAELPAAGTVRPAGTYFAWLDLRAFGLGEAPGDTLRERAGVVLTDGVANGAGQVGWLRLNFATSRAILDDILDRMVGALAR